MWYLPIRSTWCRSISSALSTSPRQICRVKERSFGFIWCCINQCWMFCQKVWTNLQSQKRWIRLSVFCSQKVHVSLIEIIIRYNFSVKKLKLESVKFCFFCAIDRQNIWLIPFYQVFVIFAVSYPFTLAFIRCWSDSFNNQRIRLIVKVWGRK